MEINTEEFVMYTYLMTAASEMKPTSRIYHYGQLWEADHRKYQVFAVDGEEYAALIEGQLIRHPSGDWKYAPYGDIQWDEYDDTDPEKDISDWNKAAWKAAVPIEEVYRTLEGYTLSCENLVCKLDLELT